LGLSKIVVQDKAYWKQYYAKNREKRREYFRKYYSIKENRDKKNAYLRETWKSRKEKEHIKKRAIRLQLIEILGKRCVQCGYDEDVRALQIDHIYGDGMKEYRQFRSKYSLYRYYLKNPELASGRLQILCANCNWIKKDERGEHPNVSL